MAGAVRTRYLDHQTREDFEEAMTRKAHGVIRHNTVILDEEIPEMEGRRVEVELRVDAAPEEDASSSAELRDAWSSWVESGEQGPIADEPDAWP
jgi:hypothetical protein